MTDPRIAAAVAGASVWADLKDIWDKAGKTAALITLPTLSVATLVNKLLEPVLTLWEVVALTWPLVISATILAMFAYPGRKRNAGGIVGIFAIICFPYAIAAILGLAPSISTKFDDKYWFWNPISWFLVPAMNVLAAYFSSWGITRTLSGAACGIFLAWVFETKILPRIRTPAVAPASPPAAGG